jgi:uncharacterized SAM-binding protein YcdF (DUF218 family)
MIYFLKWGINFFIIPLNVFWVCIIFAFLWRNTKPKRVRNILFFSVLWLLITGTKFIPDLMVYGLEKQYPALMPDSALMNKPVMVLGGGSVYDISISPQDRLSSNSLARLNEGIRLYHAFDRPIMVFSGYSLKNGVTQAAITRDAAVSLGIPKEKIFILEQPSTTEEEALAYKNIFGQKNPDLILVTSDIHMPRAMYLFRQAGLDPVPAPSDHILRKDHTHDTFWWSSHKNNFDKFSAAMHEYIGLVWAKLSCYSDPPK